MIKEQAHRLSIKRPETTANADNVALTGKQTPKDCISDD
jgi:hypothetical protein